MNKTEVPDIITKLHSAVMFSMTSFANWLSFVRIEDALLSLSKRGWKRIFRVTAFRKMRVNLSQFDNISSMRSPKVIRCSKFDYTNV